MIKNLAGEWGMFNEEWLIEKITQHIKKTSKIHKVKTELSHKFFKWMTSDYWERLEKIYNELKAQADSSIVK